MDSLSVRRRRSPEAVGAACVASRKGTRTAITKMANDERIGDAGDMEKEYLDEGSDK